MPLLSGKSKAAFQHNIKAEIEAGKPQKQAVAIAYSKQRESKAEGGEAGYGSNSMKYVDAADPAFAEGGEADSKALMDGVGQEFIDACHSKDHSKMVDALRAMIVHIKSEDVE